MFREHFKTELDLLQQLCDELAVTEPALAPMLGRHADPAMTRLLEGLAFSFARLRQRVEDDLPELVHPLLESLCPELLRPLPSATIVHLVPSPKLMTKLLVPAGATFGTAPVEGRACTFRSSTECEVAPLTLSGVELSPNRDAIRLRLELATGAELLGALPHSLRLFFAHPVAEALAARDFVLGHARKVTAHGNAQTLPLPVPCAAAMAPNDTRPAMAAAFLALRDYFVFPQRFAFVEIARFDTLVALGQETRHIAIEIALDEPVPRGITFDVSTVLIHAIGVIDVFCPPLLTVPLFEHGRRCQLRLAPEFDDAAVYSIENVALVSRSLQSHRAEAWTTSFTPHPPGARVRYAVHRVPSVVGARIDHALSFEGPPELLAEKIVAEVELLATHGDRSAQLALGDVCVPTTTSPSLIAFRNVTPVTRGAPPLLAGDRAWQAIRMMKANLSALTDRDTLSALLAMANVPAAAGWSDAKPDASRFVPLLEVRRTAGRRAERHTVRHGAHVRIVVDTRFFSSRGDVRLFGELLLPCLTATLQPDEWLLLTLADENDAVCNEYPIAFGTRHAL